MSILLLVLGLVLFIGLVVVHEWGHFVLARRNGVEVEEFGIFFPPRLFKRRTKGGWLFTINLIPLGGFVKLKGEHDADTKKGSFGAANLWAKTKIMAAGVFMNFVVAYLLLVLVALVGMPRLVPNQFTVASDTKILKNDVYVSYIEPDSPAEQAHLRSTDRLVAYRLAGAKSFKPIDSASEVSKITDKYADQKVTFKLERKGSFIQKTVKLRSDAFVAASIKRHDEKGHLGVSPSELTLQQSTWSAPVVAAGLLGQFTALTFEGLGHALAGLGGIVAGGVTGNTPARQNAQTEASSQVAGPVGIYFVLKGGSILGYQYVLFIIAIISLTLAIMNFLPIPALDGGRLWFTLFSHAIRRPMSAQTEELVNAIGFMVLMCLIILVSIVDVRRFF